MARPYTAGEARTRVTAGRLTQTLHTHVRVVDGPLDLAAHVHDVARLVDGHTHAHRAVAAPAPVLQVHKRHSIVIPVLQAHKRHSIVIPYHSQVEMCDVTQNVARKVQQVTLTKVRD